MVKYINKIECMPAQFLKWTTVLPDNHHIYQPEPLVGEELDIAGLSAVEISEEQLNGVRCYITKLTAKLRCPYADIQASLTSRPIALHLTATDGSQYIMGLASRPHPLVQRGVVFGDRPSDSSGTTIVATWKDIHPLLEVV